MIVCSLHSVFIHLQVELYGTNTCQNIYIINNIIIVQHISKWTLKFEGYYCDNPIYIVDNFHCGATKNKTFGLYYCVSLVGLFPKYGNFELYIMKR